MSSGYYYPEIVSEYEPTASQEAAIEDIKNRLGPAPVAVAFQYLVKEYPDDFENTGKSEKVVAMNYVPATEEDLTPEQRQKQLEVLEQDQQGRQESFEQEQQRKQKRLESEKENFQKHQQKQKQKLQEQHERIAELQKEKEEQRRGSREPREQQQSLE